MNLVVSRRKQFGCARTRPHWADLHKMGAFGEEREAEWNAWVQRHAQDKADTAREEIEAERFAAAEDAEYLN